MTVIKVENLSKQYRLGNVGLGSLGADVNRFWHTRILGKEDPYLKIGEENNREVAGSSGYVWALRDINFDVKQGEVLGIIGRNGAGKSTLLKILSRTTCPTTGSIKIKGRVASLLEVGTGFHPELTGRENIFLNGAILGMTKAEIRAKFDEIVAFAGVERYVDTPVKRYSSGMYVRLAFAVAAHLEPEILIVDEVLAVGDAEFQKKAIGKMKEVSEGQGRTVLFVSHNMETIAKLTQRSLLLGNGRIELMGDTNMVIRKYFDLNKSSSTVYYNSNTIDEPYIQKVSLETSLPNNVHLAGEQLRVHIDVVAPEAIDGACFSFQMVDARERNFTHLWVFDDDMPFCREKGTYRLTCTIPELKLYMGKYYLKCYFSEPPGGKVFERLENICPFEIVMYETDRTHFKWQPDTCAYLESSNWEIKKIVESYA